MNLPHIPLPAGCEVCTLCRAALVTDGTSIACENGHPYRPEEWSTKARAFVIKVWKELQTPKARGDS